MRDSFIFYKSFYESIKELDPLDQVQIYNAIFEYEFNEYEIELKGVCKSIFTLIIPQLEANNKRYKNGCKGGRPKTKTKPNDNQKETKAKPNENDNDNVNVNDNVNDKEKIIKKENFFFEDLKLNNLFLEFLDLRKKLKCKNTDRAINLLLNELNKYDDPTKIEMINNSIMNSWKSVYPPKENKTKKSAFDEVWEEIENGTITLQ